MLEVYRAADMLQRHCESQHWRFCLIGGLALQRWGEPEILDRLAAVRAKAEENTEGL